MKREDESTDNSNGSAPPVDGNAQCFYKTTGRYPSGRSQVDLDDQQARVDAVNAMLQHIGHGPITIHPHLRLALLQATITDNLTVDAARTLINAALRDDRDRWQTAHQDKEPPPIPELAPTTTDNKDDQIPSSGKQWF